MIDCKAWIFTVSEHGQCNCLVIALHVATVGERAWHTLAEI